MSSISEAKQRFYNFFIHSRRMMQPGDEMHPHDWQHYQRAKTQETRGKVNPLPEEMPGERARRLVEDAVYETNQDKPE